ncbi:MAG: L-threonine 3-dehydrogenase [Candidatus Diapherotrites archaeon]
MKVVLKSKPGKGLELSKVENPFPKKGELLVKVMAAGICGTDLHIYEWNEWAQSRIKPPLVVGHEVAGKIVELGEGVSGFEIGDLVSVETHVFCGKCFQCLSGNKHICEKMKIFGVDMNGVFAEYAVVPAQNAWKNPKKMKPEIAAIQEPFGNAVHSVFAVSDNFKDSTVLITGAGPIGCFAVGILKAEGAKKVIVSDLNDFRLKLAQKMGADVLVNAESENLVERVLSETNGRGADFFIEMAGSGKALVDGFKALRPGGRVSVLGVFGKPVQLDVTNNIVFKYATVYGINGRLIFDTWKKTSELLGRGLVDPSPVITHSLKFEDFEKGFSLLEQGMAGKVVLTF